MMRLFAQPLPMLAYNKPGLFMVARHKRAAGLTMGTVMKKKKNRLLPVAAMLTIILGLSVGCKKQAENPATPTAAARTDDQITSDIQAKLTAEAALNGQNIQVTVQNGIATLSGAVPNDASRALAGNDSGSVDGVKTVVNNLTVQAAAVIPPAPAPNNVADKTAERDRRRREEAEKRRQERIAAQQAASAQAQQQAAQPPAPPPAPVVAAAPPPPPPPPPVAKTVVIPAGTLLPIRMTDALDSKTTQPNQVFHGSLASDLIVDGMVAARQGSAVTGRVIDAKDASHFKGSSLLSIELTQISAHGRQVPVVTDAYSKEGKGRGKNTIAKTGGGAAVGAIIGALAGGGKGAAIGSVAGGGIGAGANGITRGEQVQIPSETLVNFRLQTPVSVTTSAKVGGAVKSYDDNSPQLEQRP